MVVREPLSTTPWDAGMLSKDIIAQATRIAVSLGAESPSIEFKGSAPFEKIKHGVTKAALGISNTRDGGYVIVGVHKEKGKPPVHQGVTAAIAAEFDPEVVYEFINKFASPSLDVQVLIVNVDGKDYVSIAVPPFERTPTICRMVTPEGVPKEDVMRLGDIFIRPLNRIETRRIQNGSEMDELLQRALARRVSEFFGELRPEAISRTLLAGGKFDAGAQDRAMRFDDETEDIDDYL